MDSLSERNQSEKYYLLRRILLVLLIGLPLIGFLIFDDFFLFVRRNPIEAIGLLILYGLLLLLFTFVSNLWQHVEEYTVVRLLRRSFKRVKALFSRHRKRYVQYLIYRYRDFDVKGLSTQGVFALLLEDLFIELKVAPQAAHHVAVDPLHVSEELREGKHDVWKFLSAEHLEHHDLAIIGPPGSGKTTLLQHTALSLVAGKTRVLNALSDKLPLLLFLRNHTQVISKKLDYTLAEAARFALLIGNMSDPPPNHWFEKYLQRGECLVMLDGLDEVADDTTRQRVAKWVQMQMGRYPKNRFIVTSRPFGYRSNPLRDVMVLEVQPFTLKQVRNFIERWYLANEIMSSQKDDHGVRMKAFDGAEDLIQRIRHTPSLSALAVNPLLLTMISTVHRYRSSLPERRVELYAEICDAFLGKRQQARGMTMSLTPAQKQNILQPLAYHMMKHEQRKVSHEEALELISPSLKLVDPKFDPAEFLRLIENSSGLLLERESGQYSFAHLTFQEYLAATHVLDQQLEAELLQQVEDSWWHETIRLYCARTDATKIIAACLRQDHPSIPALTLALDCESEALKVQPYVRHKLQTILQQGVEENNPERRRLVAEALLALRMKRMKRVKENLYVDDSLITNAEYQLFLDDQRATGHYFQPDHWSQHQFILGHARKAVVGVRPSDTEAFCKWLTERDTEGWRYRIPYSGESELLGKADKLAAHFIHKSVEKKEKQAKNGVHSSSAAYWTGQQDDSSYLLEGKRSVELPITRLEARLRDDCQRANDRERARTLDRDLDLDFERTFDRELAQALSDTRDLALALALELARDQKLAHTRSLTLNLSHALTHALDHTLEIDRNLSRDITRVQDIERVLTHAHEVEQNLTLMLNQQLARHRELERARDIIRHVNDIRARAINRALSRALAQTRNEALKRAYDDARSRNFAEEFNLAQAIEQARAIEQKTDNRTRVQAIERARHLERALNLDNVLGHDRRFVHKAIKSDDTSFLRWYARFILWLITESLLNMLDQQEEEPPRTFMDTFLRREKDQYWQEEVQELADHYFDLYIDLAILEERIAGKMPAFEGIRIVKERKSEG